MFDFTQITLVIGKYNKNTPAIDMLGTGFLISNEGKVVTARHVVGNETNDLCVLLPHIPNINVYQDVTDLSCRPATAWSTDPCPTCSAPRAPGRAPENRRRCWPRRCRPCG